jgi:hypothetical protein
MNSYICDFTSTKTFANKEGALDKLDLFPQMQAYSKKTTEYNTIYHASEGK